MTLKELSQLYWLNIEIKNDQKRLEDLSLMAESPSTSVLTGMPHAPMSNDSKTERLVAEILDLQAIIAAKRIQCIHEYERLKRWIDDIYDSQIREIFKCRFVDGLTWFQVSEKIGGGNTEASVKMICYRYLRESEKK